MISNMNYHKEVDKGIDYEPLDVNHTVFLS